MWQILVVGLGGSLGAAARYTLTGLMHRKFPGFLPAGTLLVNVLGCFIIGVLMALVTQRQLRHPTLQLFLITGILGSLTTFSTFGYETVELLRENDWRAAFWNTIANGVLGFGAVWLGWSLVK